VTNSTSPQYSSKERNNIQYYIREDLWIITRGKDKFVKQCRVQVYKKTPLLCTIISCIKSLVFIEAVPTSDRVIPKDNEVIFILFEFAIFYLS